MQPQLLNKTALVEYLLKEADWSSSHGAEGDYLGAGLLYYTLVYTLKARTAVCLGSGGGFVPRLMRQAQRDLGIARVSRTVLVDGNYPQAGWGAPTWLDPDSFFRSQYPDVELILDSTRYAAVNFFAAQDVSIDYLHIDADHSFQGCLEDFETYRPFLRPGSLVTLHDTNYPNAGVKHVLEYLRTRADCELIDLPEVGVGTALVRICRSEGGARFRTAPALSQDGRQIITVTRSEGTLPIEPPAKEWKYLESKAFSMRYVLAASLVERCPAVIELGGARTPIDTFLTGAHASVLVLDPLIRESYQDTLQGKSCAVSHVRARFQDVEWHIPADARYGLVILGMEFQGMLEPDWDTLYRLVDRADVTVIEFPLSWPPSLQQFDWIRANTHTRVAFQARLDLDGNDFGDMENSWPPRVDRMIYALEPY